MSQVGFEQRKDRIVFPLCGLDFLSSSLGKLVGCISWATGGSLCIFSSLKGLRVDFNFAVAIPTTLCESKVDFIIQSSNLFADPQIQDFCEIDGDESQTYVFVAEIERVSDAARHVLSNTRVEGASLVLELVIRNETHKIGNSQISVFYFLMPPEVSPESTKSKVKR